MVYDATVEITRSASPGVKKEHNSMSKKKRIIKAAAEELEKTAESAVKNFTEIPRVLLEQLFGADFTPQTKEEKGRKTNFTKLDMKSLESSYESQDEDKLDDVRERLLKQSDQGKQTGQNARFEQFRQEEKRAIAERKKEKKERVEFEEQQEQLKKKQEEEEKKKMQEQVTIPKGKKQRGSLFVRRKKTAETKPAFGKH